MKSLILIFTFIIATAIKVHAQIPNSGFENWDSVNNTIEPTNWYSMYFMTNSTGNYNAVTKSTDHYPAAIGNYSAKISNDTARYNSGITPSNFLGWGMLSSTQQNDRPLFPISGHPKSLRGYYKYLPQNGDTMSIYIHFYKNGSEITMGYLKTKIATPNWTQFQVFVNDTLYNSVDSGRIGFSTCNEPKNGQGGPRGNSVLYIDNLSFDNLISTSISDETYNKISFKLFPNPASEMVNLQIDNIYNETITLNIYNMIGQFVKVESLKENQHQISTTDLSNGMYIIEVRANKGVEKQRLIIQR